MVIFVQKMTEKMFIFAANLHLTGGTFECSDNQYLNALGQSILATVGSNIEV